MKIIIQFLVAMFLTTNVMAGDATTFGDGWPWPWGSECPFPWKQVDGSWEVKSLKREKKYDEHLLVFKVEAESEVGAKLLAIEQYNMLGILYARGQGLSEGNGRIITAIMDPVRSKSKSYKIMVRSYLKSADYVELGKTANCTQAETVMAVTFCPMNGKKCMISSNYTLVKPRFDEY